MTIEFNERGKIFTDIVSKTAVAATIQTTTHLIHGTIHVRHNERVKDELDRDELFLAVTEAKVLGEDGQVLFSAPFLAVYRSQIVWIIPEEQPESGGRP
ncbi:MAG: hypothetical protein ACP5QU_05595 [Anaerolineae bacterium]